MKLSEKQAMVLFDVAKWAARISNPGYAVTRENLLAVIAQIYNQQSDELVELDKEK